MNKTAVKSMLTLACFLIGTIVLWSVLAHVLFPNRNVEDPHAALVKGNAPLLTQIAENAMDPEQWPGINATQEVKALLEKGGITSVAGDEHGASFMLVPENPQNVLFIRYDPGNDAFLNIPRHILGENFYSWMKISAEEGTECWVGGSTGTGFCNARKLADHFYLIDAHIPA